MKTKESLVQLSSECKDIEERISQLKSINRYARQKMELRVLHGILEQKRKELANLMFRHDNIDDLLEICNLK